MKTSIFLQKHDLPFNIFEIQINCLISKLMMTMITMVKMIIYIDIVITIVSNQELFIVYAFQGFELLQ